MSKTTLIYPHPGCDLKAVLDEIGLSQNELASRTGIPASRISEVIHGRRSITVEYSIRLGRFFGQDETFWLTMQNAYEIRKIKSSKAEKINQDVKPLNAA